MIPRGLKMEKERKNFPIFIYTNIDSIIPFLHKRSRNMLFVWLFYRVRELGNLLRIGELINRGGGIKNGGEKNARLSRTYAPQILSPWITKRCKYRHPRSNPPSVSFPMRPPIFPSRFFDSCAVKKGCSLAPSRPPERIRWKKRG